MFYLVPTYKQQLKCVKPAVKTVKQWAMNAVETLRGCFGCNVLKGRDRLHHLLRGPVHSNEDNNKLP